MADYIITKSWLPGATLTVTARNTQGEVILGPVEMGEGDDGNYMVLWSAYAGQQGYFSFSDGTFSETEAFGNPQRLTADYDAAKTAAAAGDAMTLTSAERNAVADALLSRSVSTVEATADEHSLCYVVLATSQASTATHPGKLTVFRSDGVTEFVQKDVTQQAGAYPITGIG